MVLTLQIFFHMVFGGFGGFFVSAFSIPLFRVVLSAHSPAKVRIGTRRGQKNKLH